MVLARSEHDSSRSEKSLIKIIVYSEWSKLILIRKQFQLFCIAASSNELFWSLMVKLSQIRLQKRLKRAGSWQGRPLILQINSKPLAICIWLDKFKESLPVVKFRWKPMIFLNRSKKQGMIVWAYWKIAEV